LSEFFLLDLGLLVWFVNTEPDEFAAVIHDTNIHEKQYVYVQYYLECISKSSHVLYWR